MNLVVVQGTEPHASPWLPGFYPLGGETSELQGWAESWKIADGRGKKKPNKWQDGVSSLLQVCAFILGEIPGISFLSWLWEGIFPLPGLASAAGVA